MSLQSWYERFPLTEDQARENLEWAEQNHLGERALCREAPDGIDPVFINRRLKQLNLTVYIGFPNPLLWS